MKVTKGASAKRLLSQAIVTIDDCEQKRAGWQLLYGDTVEGLSKVK